MSDPNASTLPAGWYDDGSGTQRWWDGIAWTERTQGVAAPEVVQVERPRDPNILWEATGQPLKGFGGGRFRLTKEFLFFEKGTLTTKAQQIHTHEIYDVDANQSLTQKARGIGTITLKAKRADDSYELVVIEDVPAFREGVTAINTAATVAREAFRVRQQTQHINYSGAPAFPTAPATAPTVATAPAAIDLNVELAKLAAFREQGILDDEEFKAAKAKLLGL